MTTTDSRQEEEPTGSIVVVAKCPIAGKSKTRLAPFLGSEGAAFLAKALLSDVLLTLSNCSHLTKVQKCLLYAPGNEEGQKIMVGILQSLNLDDWTLMPMKDSADLLSSDVGSCMADSLQRARTLHSNKSSSSSRNQHGGRVLFLGMDAPELPLEEIIAALAPRSESSGAAVMCPASDGGFAMLCLPERAPPTIFNGVRWSQSLTAVSQLKALTDHNIPVRLGRLMHDMDEAEDVKALAERLCQGRSGSVLGGGDINHGELEPTKDVLMHSSGLSRLPPMTGKCEHTWNTLVALGLIEQSGNDVTTFRVRNGAFVSVSKELKP